MILAQKDWQKVLATSIMEEADLVPQNDLAKKYMRNIKEIYG